MPSLNDIPTHLLQADMKLDFLHWLATRPIDFYTAKQLMRLWSTQTNRFFDSDDYNFISRIRSL